jgi:hypothetical protein
MSRPMRASLVLAALGALLAGWGSCGGSSYSCSYTCADTETFGFLSDDIMADSVEKAEATCESTVPTTCQSPHCSCKVAGNQ